MLKPEEKAFYLYDRAIKTCVSLSCEMKKSEAKTIVTASILSIKEALYDACLLDSLHTTQLRRSLEYYQAVQLTIDKL